MSAVPVELDPELISVVEARAAATGKSRDEVIADGLRRGFGLRRISDILDEGRVRDDVTEDEATRLAKELLAEVRAESPAS